MDKIEFKVVYVTRDMPWRDPRDPAAPMGRLFEIRTVPGNVVAWGRDPREAKIRMKEVLDRLKADAGGEEAWVVSALHRALKVPQDRADVQRFGALAFWGKGATRSVDGVGGVFVSEDAELETAGVC